MYIIGIICFDADIHSDDLLDLIRDRQELCAVENKIVTNNVDIITYIHDADMAIEESTLAQMLSVISEALLIRPTMENMDDICPRLVEKNIPIIPCGLQSNVNS